MKGWPRPVGSVPVGTPRSLKSRPDPRPSQARGGPALPNALGPSPAPRPPYGAVPSLGGMRGRHLRSATGEAQAAAQVFCRCRCHGSAPLRAAGRAGPGAVRAVAAGPRRHRVAGGAPSTGVPGAGDPGAGECPGGHGGLPE